MIYDAMGIIEEAIMITHAGTHTIPMTKDMPRTKTVRRVVIKHIKSKMMMTRDQGLCALVALGLLRRSRGVYNLPFGCSGNTSSSESEHHHHTKRVKQPSHLIQRIMLTSQMNVAGKPILQLLSMPRGP
jgi:hypothetical protein